MFRISFVILIDETILSCFQQQSQLSMAHDDLSCQATLTKRAQQNWVLSERKCREREDELSHLRATYATELESLRNDLLPHVDRSRSEAAITAAQVQAVQAKYEKERNELKVSDHYICLLLSIRYPNNFSTI